jgi:hypothetical protein
MSIGLWSSNEWRERAVAWLDRVLADAGIQRTDEVEQPHLRPWATALRARTTQGVFWLKAAGAGTAFEIKLYALLERLVPGSVLRPLALDEGLAWMVLPDGGPLLGDRVKADDFVEVFATALARYGELQRRLTAHADQIVAFGVADMRPAVMPERFEEALEIVSRFVERGGKPEERETLARLQALAPRFRGWCERLAASALASLDHNDLHPWNVFASPHGDGSDAMFFDWGDSVVSHPFASLIVPLRILRLELRPDEGDARVERVRSAYLSAFADLGTPSELAEQAELACKVGLAARCITWQRAVQALGPDKDEVARAPYETLAQLVDGQNKDWRSG